MIKKMKAGMKSVLGIGFLAALAGLANDAKSMQMNSEMPFIGNGHYGSPMFFTRNPNRKRKVNKLRLSHNAKIKRRKSA